MANPIAIAREQKIFCVKETTKGTLVFPAASNYIVAAGYGAINQTPEWSNSDEINDSRSILDRFQNKSPAGDWAFPVYARPSGTAGDAPGEDVLLECLLGTKTVNSSTSVVYTAAKTKPSFSIWIQKDHTVFFAKGASVGSMKAALQTTGGVQFDFSGQFMEMGWAGTDALNGAIDGTTTAVTALVVDDAKKYTVGARIQVGTNTNTTSGFEVTAVNTTTNTLTVSPGVDSVEADNTTVAPYLPTGTVVGDPLEARKGKANIGSADVPVMAMEVNINDAPKYLDDEITTDGYPSEYVEEIRDVNGTLKVYFRQNDVDYIFDGQNTNSVDLDLIAGDTAGSIVTFSMPYSVLSVPTIEDNAPTVALNMSFQCEGSSGEDEILITYT